MNLRLVYAFALIIALAAQGTLAGQDYKFQIVECGSYGLSPTSMNNAWRRHRRRAGGRFQLLAGFCVRRRRVQNVGPGPGEYSSFI
jgi:hypothetical protein